MLARRTVSLLDGFQSKDWRALDKWLASPIHNTDVGLQKLGEYFKSIAPEYNEETLAKVSLWRATYDDKPLKEGVLRVKLRQFTSQVEDFLSWQKYSEDEDLKKRMLLKAQSSNLSFDNYEHKTLKLLKKLEAGEKRGINFFYEKLQLESDLIGHPQFDNYRSNSKYLEQTNESLDAFFTLFKYRLGCEIKNRERIRGGAYNLRFWEVLKDHQERGAVEGNPIMGLYHLLFQVLDTPADYSLVEKLKEVIVRTHHLLPLRDANNIYYSVLNHLSRMINQGGSEYYPRTLSWYRMGLETGILLVEDKISHITFNNIALLGYQADEFDWTEAFLSTFGPHLREDQREDALSACRGIGAFYQNEYQRAIEILSGHKFGPSYQLRQRLTIIRAYYELLQKGEDVFEILSRKVSTFNSFLYRNSTFSDLVCAPYKNHLRLLRLLMDRELQNDRRAQTRSELINEIELTDQLVAKQWLLDKV